MCNVAVFLCVRMCWEYRSCDQVIYYLFICLILSSLSGFSLYLKQSKREWFNTSPNPSLPQTLLVNPIYLFSSYSLHLWSLLNYRSFRRWLSLPSLHLIAHRAPYNCLSRFQRVKLFHGSMRQDLFILDLILLFDVKWQTTWINCQVNIDIPTTKIFSTLITHKPLF